MSETTEIPRLEDLAYERRPEVGDTVRYWWAPEGTTVVAVKDYTGWYQEHFAGVAELIVPARQVYRKTTRDVLFPHERKNTEEIKKLFENV